MKEKIRKNILDEHKLTELNTKSKFEAMKILAIPVVIY